jgi:predicted dehydrogenase
MGRQVAVHDRSNQEAYWMSDNRTRRAFLNTLSGWGAASLGLGSPLFSEDLVDPKNSPGRFPRRKSGEKLRIAVVGCGNRGLSNLTAVASEDIVAVCDVEARFLLGAKRRFPLAHMYRDFRQMLEQENDAIDAVVVSTPDHTHAPVVAETLRRGKHCYCEKPLAHNIAEVRELTKLAAETPVATQMGIQMHAGSNYRRVVEWIQSGVLGPVRKVVVWSDETQGGRTRPARRETIPRTLAWDLWLGPAEEREYNSCYCPVRWRDWWDFSNGAIGDFGCHFMDLPFWALGLDHPTTVEAEGPEPDQLSCAPWMTVKYQFPARGDRTAVTLTWRHGPNNRPPELESLGTSAAPPSDGVLFIGEDGMLMSTFSRHWLLPEGRFLDASLPEPTSSSPMSHHAEWIQACKTGGTPSCHFGYAGPLTETTLLGSVAFRAKQPLTWDGVSGSVVDCPEAEQFLMRNYRSGWKIS